ncbi:MAG: hypothetical protein ACOC56_00200 [Atribacterota bacterium]
MIDVLITSSSRPLLIPYLITSLRKFIDSQCNTKLRLLLHEDFVIPNKSDEVMRWAHRLKKFDVMKTHNPKIGLGMAMDYMFKNHVKSKYMFYLQDDWEFERPGIDLDRILWTMDRNPEINLVLFSPFKNKKTVKHFKESKEFVFDGQKFTLYNGWSFVPGIWRMSFVRKKWKEPREYKPEGFFTNLLGTNKQRESADYCIKNIGTYLYGGFDEYKFINHLGCTWRVADWRLEDGDYGGDINFEVSKIKDRENDRAPWLDPYEPRPMYTKNKGNPDLSKLNDKQKKEFEHMAKEIY